MLLATAAYDIEDNRETWSAWVESVYGSPDAWHVSANAGTLRAVGAGGKWVLVAAEKTGALQGIPRGGEPTQLPSSLKFAGVLGDGCLLVTDDGQHALWGIVGDPKGPPRFGQLSGGPLAPAARIVVTDSQEIKDDYFPSPQTSEVEYIRATELSVEVTDAGTDTKVALQVTVEGAAEVISGVTSLPGLAVLSRIFLSPGIELSWWSAAELVAAAKEGRIPTKSSVTASTVLKPTATADGSIWWVDGGQVRAWRGLGDHERVSDASFGSVLHYAASIDGKWLATQHTSGQLHVQAIEQAFVPRTNSPDAVQWAALADHEQLVLAVVGQDEKRLVESTFQKVRSGNPAWTTHRKLRDHPNFPPQSPYKLAGLGFNTVVANDFPGFAVCRFPASGNPASSSIKDIGVRRHPAYAGAAVSPDGKRVALSDRPAGPGRSSVDVYSGVDFRHVETIALSDKVFGTDGARYLAFASADSSSLWIASRTGVGLWNAAKKEFFWQHATTIGSMASHPKRDLADVDNGDGSIVVVDVEGTIVDAGSVGGRKISLAFHPKYELLAIGDERGRLLLWDWQGMRSVAAIQLGGQVSGVGFNHDGTILWTIAGGELTMRDVGPDALRELTFQRTNGAMDVDLWNRLTENRPVPSQDPATRHRD